MDSEFTDWLKSRIEVEGAQGFTQDIVVRKYRQWVPMLIVRLVEMLPDWPWVEWLRSLITKETRVFRDAYPIDVSDSDSEGGQVIQLRTFSFQFNSEG